jgi:5-deoxy-glucuronate isomerase
MATDRLLRRPSAPDADGLIQSIEPAPPEWTWSSFKTFRLDGGGRIEDAAADSERLLIVLEGRASVRLDGRDAGLVGLRESVFDGPPAGLVLVAPGVALEATATGPALIVLAAAPAGPVRRTAVIRPDEILVEHRGTGGTARRVHHLLAPGAEAGRLIAFEVFTPAGNWSSFPPHKHDTEEPPTEALLQEIYFYRFARPGAFGFQRVYSPDRSLDETYAVGDLDVVLVPRGYHVFAAPVGYEAYYLNVMAGPNRAWHFTIDPDHRWLMDWSPSAPNAADG